MSKEPGPVHQVAYLISLLLSHLRSVTPILASSGLHPDDAEVRRLREFFQYFATAAVAAEVGGPAWSFGFPRPDGTGFTEKLTVIWTVLRDGRVEPDPSAPDNPKDDQVDIFSYRPQPDGLPGFLLVAGQVATGANWKSKSIKSHIGNVFQTRWFGRQPVTIMVPYHVIPFARPDGEFRDDVLVLGNVLHRIRVPARVLEAVELEKRGVSIEAFDRLNDARAWLTDFSRRARAE